MSNHEFPKLFQVKLGERQRILVACSPGVLESPHRINKIPAPGIQIVVTSLVPIIALHHFSESVHPGPGGQCLWNGLWNHRAMLIPSWLWDFGQLLPELVALDFG